MEDSAELALKQDEICAVQSNAQDSTARRVAAATSFSATRRRNVCYSFDMTFPEVLSECVANADFVRHWARLRGIRVPLSGIERMIDAATGYNDTIGKRFVADVYDLVWCRIPRNDPK